MCDAYGRYLIRMDEIEQSLRIIRQCVDRLAALGSPGPDKDPVMIRDAKIGGRAGCRSARTASVPRRSTSRTSWASPWRHSFTTSS